MNQETNSFLSVDIYKSKEKKRKSVIYIYIKQKDFYKLLRLSIKKGKKKISNNNFKKALFLLAKKKVKSNKIIKKALFNTKPYINLHKKKKQGFFVTYIKKRRQSFLSCKWIIAQVKKPSNNKFHKYLVEELLKASVNQGAGIQQRINFHELAIQILNIRKRKIRKINKKIQKK